MKTMTLETDGAAMIAAERRRQIEEEGWTPESDDGYRHAQLVNAGRSYAWAAAAQLLGLDPAQLQTVPSTWPFDREWWKPSDTPLRNLVRAGALMAAEIDRLQRETAGVPEAGAGEAGRSAHAPVLPRQAAELPNEKGGLEG